MNDRELLEQEELRQKLLTELSRRHNWEQQEQFWQRQMRNWEEQEGWWKWQTRLLLGTLAIGVLGIISRVLWP